MKKRIVLSIFLALGLATFVIVDAPSCGIGTSPSVDDDPTQP